MIAIVNYGASNLRSVVKASDEIGELSLRFHEDFIKVALGIKLSGL